ncbi:MAG: PKD domain-containing protein [Ideonella sp.]|nr:PKD domain-containing protein [Ideonella sp.]
MAFTPAESGVHVLMVRAAAGRSGLYRLAIGGASGELRLPVTTGASACGSTVEGVLRGQAGGRFSIAVQPDGRLGGTVTLASAPGTPLAVVGSVAAGGRVAFSDGASLSASGYLGPDGDLTGTWSTGPAASGGGSLVGDCAGARVLDNRPPEAGAVDLPPTFQWGVSPPLSRSGPNQDVDGDLVKAGRWRLVSKPAGSVTALRPGAFPKSLDADLPGDYVLELIVHDGKVDSAPVRATVRAVPANSLPVADAGPDRTAQVGALVTLDGSRSLDADGAVTFRWEVVDTPVGGELSFGGGVDTLPQLSFIPPVAGHYVFRLTVSDGQSVASDEAVVVAVGDGVVPFGAPRSLRAGIGSSLSVQGRPGSSAALVPQWRLTGAPLASTAALEGPSGDPTVTLRPDRPGSYGLRLDSLALATGALVGSTITTVDAFDLAGLWSGQIGSTGQPSLLSFGADAGGALVGQLDVGFVSCGRNVRLVRQFSAPQRLFDASGNRASFRFLGASAVSTMTATLLSSARMEGTLSVLLSATPDCPAQTLVLPWQASR